MAVLSAPRRLNRRALLTVVGAVVGIAGVGVLAACGNAATTATTGSSAATPTTSNPAAATAGASPASSAAAASSISAQSTASGAGAVSTSSVSSAAAATSSAAAAAMGPTPSPAPPVFGKGSISLLFLNGLGGDDGATMKTMLANYVTDHPTVSIDFQTLGWNDVFKKLDTTLVAGTPPELVVMHATEIPQYGSRAALQPVDTWFAKKLLPKDDFHQTVLDKATYQGKILAVPLDIHDYNTYVSVDLLKQAGIDPDKQPVGQDFIDAAQKLSRDQKDPAKATFGTAGFGGFGTMALLWQYGGDVLTPDGKEVIINAPEAQEALQMYNDLIYKYQVYPDPSIKYTDLRPVGRVAYRTDDSWAYNYYKSKGVHPPEVAASQFPQIGPKPVVWLNSHELTIPVGVSGTKFDEAQKLIVWISEHGGDWARSGQPPARTSQQTSAALQEDWAWSVRAFAQITAKYGRYEVSPPRYTQVRDLQYRAFDDVAHNKAPVKTILDDYARQIKGVLTQ